MSSNHFLHRVFSPSNFRPEELLQIVSKFKQVKYSKEDYLLESGRTANNYWFVEQGLLRSYVVDAEGNEISTGFFSVGDIVIDWPSFFLREPTREYIQALSDCNCWQLDYENFQTLFHNIEAFREQGRATLVGSYFALKKNHVALVADRAKDRYMRLMEEQPEIVQQVPLKYIASFLGVTDTSLSRIRREIANER